MALGTGVEVELAVAKGEAYLYKVRFRPSSILTVGTNPMTAITLDGDGVPAFLEFLNITSDGVLLRFTPDIRVEVLSGNEVLATQALISGGFANRAGDAYGVELESGSKAVIRLGGHKLMIKVDVPTGQDVLMVNASSVNEAACGRCGTRLRLVLAGGGALTPCAACGALNRVTLASTKQQQLEEQATRVAIPSGTAGGTEANEDAQSNLADVVDPGSSTGRAIADLPTFDAISVLKDSGEGADDATREALEELGLGGGSRRSPAMANLASPDQVDPGSSTGRAASDLPTFDAIAVLEQDAPPPAKPATVNLAAGKPDAKPAAAPPPVAISIPASDPAPVQSKEVSVSSTPPNQGPSAGQNDEYAPSTGQWEETLTIQAVKPKARSMILPLVVIILALLGIVGLVAAVVVVKFII